jgi:hypothetical protein
LAKPQALQVTSRGRQLRSPDRRAHPSVLRIETTIDNPREFKTLRRIQGSPRWVRIAKGVANFWRLNPRPKR